jgi:hypothetical protein
MFLGSNFSMGLSVTLSDETGSQKSKMAAGDNVISRISANIHDSNEFPTANPTFSAFSISMKLLSILSDVSRSPKSKMAACKPEVLLSQVLDKIKTRFQRLTHIFGVQHLNGTTPNTVRCEQKS